MKAIRIDVTNKCVEQVDVGPTLDDIYKQIDCRVITIVSSEDSELACEIYVDDESLLKDPTTLPGAFWAEFFPSQPLFGHGLIVSVDHETGERIDCTLKAEQVSEKIRFLTEDEVTHYHYLLKNIPVTIIPLSNDQQR
ncbi:MAG: hypothetical protein EBR30_02330 [Cytophagia bacterium]|nr:hypothetical protein [Cytophagia bacterium]